MVRRHEDQDDDGALSRSARPAWQLLLLIGTILTGAVTVLVVQRFVAVAAAQEVVRPLEKRFDEHVLRAEGDERYRALVLQRLTALCEATPTARCSLGER